MTSESLNEAICEFLEPKETAGYKGVCGVWHSAKGFWFTDAGYDGKPSMTAFKPRDMVHDPAMTVMLFSELLTKYGSYKAFDAVQSAFEWYSESDDAAPMPLGECLRRAVAEAFAKANGICEAGGKP